MFKNERYIKEVQRWPVGTDSHRCFYHGDLHSMREIVFYEIVFLIGLFTSCRKRLFQSPKFYSLVSFMIFSPHGKVLLHSSKCYSFDSLMRFLITERACFARPYYIHSWSFCHHQKRSLRSPILHSLASLVNFPHKRKGSPRSPRSIHSLRSWNFHSPGEPLTSHPWLFLHWNKHPLPRLSE